MSQFYDKEELNRYIIKWHVKNLTIQVFLILFFFDCIIQSVLFFQVSLLIAIGFLLINLFLAMEKRESIIISSIIAIIIAIIIVIFVKQNILYNTFKGFPAFQFPALMDLTNFSAYFFDYFAYLTIFSLISMAIITIVYYYSKSKQEQGEGEETEEEGEEKGEEPALNYWDFFMYDRSFTKFIVLVCLLSVASLYEEIIYRYISMNAINLIYLIYGENLQAFINLMIIIVFILGIVFSITLYFYLKPDSKGELTSPKVRSNERLLSWMIISGILFFTILFMLIFRWYSIFSLLNLYFVIFFSGFLFGIAHYGNGGWSYVINSTFAGIIFAIIFLNFGLMGSWIEHLFWNSFVIIQMFLDALAKEKKNK